MDFSKKCILYIGGFELPDKNAAAQRVITNGKMLAELDYEVFYLGTRKNNESMKMEDTKSTFRGFTYWSHKYPEGLAEWFKYITSADQIIDVVENYMPTLPYAIIAYDFPAIALAKLLRYCKRKRILLIGDTTDWYKTNQGDILFRLVKSFDTFYRMRIVHCRLDGVITVSKYLYDYYKKRTLNVLLLPPLVDLEDKKWESTKEINLAENIRLVYAGQPFAKGSKTKDRLDKVLFSLSETIMLQATDFELSIIGATKDSYLQNYGAGTIPDNINDKIFFLGRISHSEVLEAVKAADYSIFIRDDDRFTKAGFPTKFVESISCGTPVLTNRSSNIADYLIEGKYGFLIDVSDREHLTDSLLNAITLSKKKINEMKSACKNSRLFDYHNYLSSLKDFLSKLKFEK